MVFLIDFVQADIKGLSYDMEQPSIRREEQAIL